ncbi:maleylpyruvate isomerase family mycothiol-dependent enzyme [uncultured Nocardioides sp.]|uniref:maleylpyruvate isomerase family mycothiol-dependent enzyme n=1 Tax=uncultured Nocardioides sp. TaxID=198441 RepID=UPI0026239AA8|nr:maleylpyruvate isomerase family mycothiol-dependent enzyme [uncultured Nocardioides sp.]
MDPILAWREAHSRVVGLLTGLDPRRAGTVVPACPDWTVRDLLSHMVGLAADVLDGDEPDDHNEQWTKAQVEARRDRSVAELLAEWGELVEDLVAWMGENGSRPLNDVVIHEQDLRGALDQPGARDSDGLRVVRDRLAGRLADAAADLPPLLLVEARGAGGDPWTFVTRGSADDAACVVSADGFELFRALTSRRTEDQLRAMVVHGDVSPYLPAFAGLGSLPDETLPE